MFKSKKIYIGKRGLALLLSVLMVVSLFVCVPALFQTNAEETGFDYIEVKPGKAWTSVIYRGDTLEMKSRGYYKFSFDYKVTSGNPVFKIDGYDSTSGTYKALENFCSAYQMTDTVENGICKRIVTLRVKPTTFTGIQITIGAYTEASDIGCVFGNPQLYRYKNNSYEEKHDTTPDNLLSDVSEANIYDVMAEDPVHKSNLEGKWNFRYLTGCRAYLANGTLTKNDYKELFAPPKYMLRLYEGNQNADIEYIDRDIDLQAGTYTLDCLYKTTVETADFTVAVSTDNGVTFQNVATTVTDSANSKRQVQFTLSEAANALKITMGNPTDRTDVSVAFADPVLTKSGEDVSLIRPIAMDAVTQIGLTDTLADKTWNMRRDTENAEAVGVCVIPEDYFADEKAGILYETYAGFGWTRIEYTNAAVSMKAGKTYLFTADFKLKSGSLPNNQIGVTQDPFIGVLVDTMNIAGYGKDIYLSTKNADYFSGITTEFDESQGKVFIRFSPKDDLKGVLIRIGNYCETPIGSCAIANPKLMEYSTKLNGVTVLGDTMIKNITEDTVHNPKDGKSANSELGKWNTIHLNNQNAFHVGEVTEGYFEPENAYIKTQSSAENARIEYTDHSTVFAAGTRYELSFNYRVYSGEPETVLSFKNIGGVVGEYTALTDKADFITNFNDEIDEKSYVRTISFTPKKDLSDLKLAIGALSGQANVSVAIANAGCYALNKDSLKVGDSMLQQINRPNIARNSAAEKVWNLVSDKETDIVVSVPIPKGAFVTSKMVRIKSGYSWNRAVYYDDSLILEPNTTYRFSVDYIAGGGSPAFSMTFNDPATNKRTNVINFASSYNTWLDKRVAMRYIEFTTKPDISGVKGIEITIGNSTESTDISCVFANPTFTKMVGGEPAGDNLIYNINDRTVQFMGTMMYDGTWNLRYQGAKNVALVLEDIPENYFRVPALEVASSSGSVTQFVTAKSNTNYALSFRFRNEGGSDCTPYIEAFSASGSLGQITYGQVTRDTDGYYSYKCEFKTPAGLRAASNLRVGIKADGIVGAFSDFRLYELNSGFEQTGVNLIRNGSFDNLKSIPVYNGTPDDNWVFEGSNNHALPSYRTNAYFKIPVPQVYLFAGGSNGNYIGRTLELATNETYKLSFNLKYANPGYEGDTGVELTYKNGTEWTVLPSTVSESKTEFESTYTFTMPADATTGQNMRFRIKVGSYYVSGSVSNAKLFNTKDMNTNLIENGDFADGSTGWESGASFKQTYLYELPDGYFRRDRFKDSMIIYRNSGSWDNICQNYLALKSDAYYLLVAEGVHPWPDESEIRQEDVGQVAKLGATYAIQVSRTEDGKRVQPFLGATVKNLSSEKNSLKRIYHTPTDLESGSNAYFRMVMQDVGDAGYWGSFALYECNEKGEILSNNVLLNSDFSLGFTAWTLSIRNDDASYRIVKQPDGFFKNYKKNGGRMIESTGSSQNALLGQTLTVERGTTYYFTGFYVSMNSAGLTPKVLYKDKNGKMQEYAGSFFYDPDRFYFETEFTLPDDAYADRGKAQVQFVLTNSDKGKGYLSDLMLYKEGEYINLLQNADFAKNFTGWTTNANYRTLPYDAGVFVFHYDDKKFDDGDWAGSEGNGTTLQKGKVTGSVFDGDGNPVRGIRLFLEPGHYAARTDSSGQYTFENLSEGNYQLYLQDNSGKRHYITDVFVSDGMSSSVSGLYITLLQDEDGDIEDITVEEEKDGSSENLYGVVCGYLMDAKGNPLKGETLYLGKVGKVVTKKKGVFQFDDVKPGEYDIYLKNKDGSLTVLKRVKVVAGKGKIYKLYLPEEDNFFVEIFTDKWPIGVAAVAVIILAAGGTVLTILLAGKKKKKKKTAVS